MTRFRFRVRTPDGDEKVTEFEAETPPMGYVLETPEFSEAEFVHGDRARVRVEGRGLEGRSVRFLIEHRGAAGWEPYAEATAKMAKGVASAEVDLHHPHVRAGGAATAEVSPADLRMSCEPLP